MRRSNAVAHRIDLFDPIEAPRAFLTTRHVKIAGEELEVSPVFSAYWTFAAERQAIFFKRIGRANVETLTDDPVLARFKFTNAYRASDRVSQYLIRNVIYRDDLSRAPEEVFFRTLLFKIFNKIETWEALESAVGEISLRTFNYTKYDAILLDRFLSGESIYSAAYIMPSCGRVFGEQYKHQNHLRLISNLIERKLPRDLWGATSMSDAYQLLLAVPSLGPFLAYQYATDFNYSELTNFAEHEFVVAGPGALDGIQKCFAPNSRVSATDIIRYMYETQDFYFSKLGLSFQNLWGRRLQLIDCQNLFCEISKYARVAFPEVEGISGRTRIKQKFLLKGAVPTPWYPPKWNINDKIAER